MAGYLRQTYARLRFYAHEKPAIFYSLLIGAAGPVLVMVVPPIRRYYGYVQPERLPMSYPVPQRPRRQVQGYDDE